MWLLPLSVLLLAAVSQCVPTVEISGSGEAVEGEDYTLTCAVMDESEIVSLNGTVFQWDKVNNEANDTVDVSQAAALSFNPVLRADEGVYRCTATVNSSSLSEPYTVMGTTHLTITRLPPGPISFIHVGSRSATKIVLFWRVENYIYVDHWNLTYNYTFNGCDASTCPSVTRVIQDGRAKPHPTTAIISDLEEDVILMITVVGINDEGIVVNTTETYTLSSWPSAAPSSVSVTDVGATDITIEWTEVDCADHNGLVTGYNVRYGLQSNSSREIAFVPANVSRSYTIYEVMDHSVYEIEVALVNLNGAGVYSTPITYMNFVPVELEFSPSSVDNLLVVISGSGEAVEGEDYTLTCAVTDENVAVPLNFVMFHWDKVNDTVDVSQAAALSFNPVLRADEGVYRCTATVNSSSLSEPYTVVGTTQLTITRRPPGPIGHIYINTRSASSIAFHWTVENYVYVDYWNVTYNYTILGCDAPPAPNVTLVIQDGVARPHTKSAILRGIEEYSNVMITIVGVNDEGTVTNTTSARTLSSWPTAAPSSINVLSISSIEIYIGWSAVDCVDHNGFVNGYRVRWGLTSSTVTSRRTILVPLFMPRRFTLKRLISDSSYEIDIAVVNINGDGVYSSPIVVNTTAVVVTNLSVVISGSSGEAVEGEDYTLTCAVMDGSVAVTLPNAVFRWDKVNDTVDLSGGATLSFNPVLRADEGVYRCTATANNTEPFSVVGTSSLSVTRLPPGPIEHINISPHVTTGISVYWTVAYHVYIDYWNISYNYSVIGCEDPPSPPITLTYEYNSTETRGPTVFIDHLREYSVVWVTVTLVNDEGTAIASEEGLTAYTYASAGPSSVNVTADTTSITIEWNQVDCVDRNGPEVGYNIRYGLTSSSSREIAYVPASGSRTLTVEGLRIRSAYVFEVALVTHKYYRPKAYSSPVTATTAIPSGVGFYLNGSLYSNNSAISIRDVGEGTDALYCLTDRADCCAGAEDGNWFLPGQDSPVPRDGEAAELDFSTSYGSSSVLLNRRNTNASLVGVYRCQVLDASNVIESVFITLLQHRPTTPPPTTDTTSRQTSSQSISTQQQSTQGGVNVGTVAGGVAGAVFLLVLAVSVALGVLWIVRRRNKSSAQYTLFSVNDQGDEEVKFIENDTSFED